MVFIFIPRPKSDGAEGLEGVSETTAKLSTGMIRIPICDRSYVESPFECQVGDIIILEEGEQMLVRRMIESHGNPKDFCVLCAVHSTLPYIGIGKKNEA